MQLGSDPWPWNSICHGAAKKEKKKKKKKKKEAEPVLDDQGENEVKNSVQVDNEPRLSKSGEGRANCARAERAEFQLGFGNWKSECEIGFASWELERSQGRESGWGARGRRTREDQSGLLKSQGPRCSFLVGPRPSSRNQGLKHTFAQMRALKGEGGPGMAPGGPHSRPPLQA